MKFPRTAGTCVVRFTGCWALLTAMLAGCGTVYEPAAGEPTARLRLLYLYSTPQHAKGYELYKLDRCPAEASRVAFEGMTPSRIRTLGMPGRQDSGPAEGTEVRIPAHQPVGVEMNSTLFRGTKFTLCSVALRFDPQSDTDYEARFRWLDGGTRCGMDLRRLTAGPPPAARGRRSEPARGWRPEPTARAVAVSGARKDFCATP